VVKLVGLYGDGHGVRQKIANELGVHRSTISRDIAAVFFAPRVAWPPVFGPPPKKEMTTSQRIAAMEAAGKRLVANGCKCEDKTEPRHALGHLLRGVDERDAAIAAGKVEATEREQEVLEGLRARLWELLR